MRQSLSGGKPVQISPKTPVPPNWKAFLCVDANKAGLYDLLAGSLEYLAIPEGKVLVTTRGKHVWSSAPMDVSAIDPSYQEEADYRMVLHASHASQQGYDRVLLQASDTDDVVIAAAMAREIHTHELWVSFGKGQSLRYIPFHTVAERLGNASQGLLFMHAISDCDTASSFSSIGKKTAWDVWRAMAHITPLFCKLSEPIPEVSAEDFAELERYVVLLYNRSSTISHVNEARKHLFAFCNRQICHIPPTKAALFQHVKRAVYQAGHVWGQALTASPVLPSPSEWGWKEDENGDWIPLWTTQPDASAVCRELIKCSWRVGCSGRCSCYKAAPKCTELCACAGQCNYITRVIRGDMYYRNDCVYVVHVLDVCHGSSHQLCWVSVWMLFH